jgi:hypothetical protein
MYKMETNRQGWVEGNMQIAFEEVISKRLEYKKAAQCILEDRARNVSNGCFMERLVNIYSEIHFKSLWFC